MLDVSSSGSLSDHSCSTVLLPSLLALICVCLATIYASRLLQLHLIPFTLPISLNSLDLAGVRLLSPRDSPDTSKPACRCQRDRAGDAPELKEELDEDLILCVVS